MLKTIVTICLFSAAILACPANAGPTVPAADAPEDLRQEIIRRLSTAITPSTLEGWVCISDKGETMSYHFFSPGSIDDFDSAYLGMEIVLMESRPDPSREPEPWYFSWSLLSDGSLVLDSPVTGEQVNWTALKFSDEGKLMRAFSSTRGELYCSRESRERN